MIVSEFLRYFMSVKSPMLANNTIKGYTRNMTLVNAYIGDMELSEVKPLHIQEMYSAMQETLSGTTVLYVHRVLKQALNLAHMQELIDRNPCLLVMPPRKNRQRITVLNEEQAQLLLDECYGSDLFLPVALALYLGLRRGEVLGLRYSDFDAKRYTVTIARSAEFKNKERITHNTKTISGDRTLLLSPALFNLLYDYSKHNSGYLCDITQGLLNKKFRRKLETLGLPHIRFHDLRHTCATLMLKDKIPSKVVSARLGHSKVGVTLDLYTHVTVELQEGAACAFDKMLPNGAMRSKSP